MNKVLELTLMRFEMQQLRTRIKISESIISAIDEIQDLWRMGILTGSEYIEISDRIGWEEL